VGTLGALKLPPFGGEAKAAEVHGPARTLVQSRCLAAPGAVLALFLGMGTPAGDGATYEAGVIVEETIASVVWEWLIGGEGGLKGREGRTLQTILQLCVRYAAQVMDDYPYGDGLQEGGVS
jgi:hypothetical protein